MSSMFQTLTCAAFLLAASVATTHSATITYDVDFMIVGDDETERHTFENPFLPDEPMDLWFEGFAENLDDGPIRSNGLIVELFNARADDVRLPPLVPGEPAPITLHASLSHSPPIIGIEAEGLGCCDNIRVSGTLTTIGVVPEPSAWTMLWTVLVILRRQDKTSQIASQAAHASPSS